MDKKKAGACGAGFIAALLYGGAELMDLASRVTALEAQHPEMEEESNASEEGKESPPPALGKPGMSAPPIEAPEGLEEEPDGDEE